jgi:hypothetical protein
MHFAPQLAEHARFAFDAAKQTKKVFFFPSLCGMRAAHFP